MTPRTTAAVTTGLDLAGLGLIVWSAWLLWWPLAVLVAGFALLVISWQLTARTRVAVSSQAADGSRLI